MLRSARQSATVGPPSLRGEDRRRSLKGFQKPHGLAYLPALGAFAIANGDAGTLQLVDAQSFAVKWTRGVGADADSVCLTVGALRRDRRRRHALDAI